MSHFVIGDKVEVLDESLKGVVQEVDGNWVTVELEDGFLMRYSTSELIKTGHQLSVTNYDVAKIKNEKEIPRRKRPNTLKPKEKNAPKMA